MQVVNFVVVLLLHHGRFKRLDCSLLSDEVLQYKYFLTRFTFTFFQSLHLRKDKLVILIASSELIVWIICTFILDQVRILIGKACNLVLFARAISSTVDVLVLLDTLSHNLVNVVDVVLDIELDV